MFTPTRATLPETPMAPVPRDLWRPRLPYGEDFLFVDDVLRWDGRGIETSKRYPASLPALAAHFVNGPRIVPGVFLIEQVCQSSLIWALLAHPERDRGVCYLGQVRAVFYAPVPAGAASRARATIETLRSALGFEGEVFADGGETAACRVSGTVLMAPPSGPAENDVKGQARP